MEQKAFQYELKKKEKLISQIRSLAHDIHNEVNQKYDKNLPYSFHLDSVANNVAAYGAEICAQPSDVAPIMFGAYFHDSIEDARLTYNNVLAIARQLFDDEKDAVMCTEIVYALTNEKGRNRAERANERYYQGIRATPYAPMVKLADRLANLSYSVRANSTLNCAMLEVYRNEMPHFLQSIAADEAGDPRLQLPALMLERINMLL